MHTEHEPHVSGKYALHTTATMHALNGKDKTFQHELEKHL